LECATAANLLIRRFANRLLAKTFTHGIVILCFFESLWRYEVMML